MIIGHLPSGYILGKAVRISSPLAMGVLILGAVFPDFDLLWFCFVDNRAIHHHRYWVHAPGFWALVTLALLPLLWWAGQKARKLWALFVMGTLLHCLLDTLTGGIMWGWPFNTELIHLITVQPTQSHWILSFVFHWTFLLEILLWIVAGWLLLHPRPADG